MLRIVKVLFALGLCAALAACSSNVRMGKSAYAYGGEKYGKVSITLSDAVAKDKAKSYRAEDLALDQHIISALKGADLYDEKSARALRVTVNSIRVRNTFNAVMFGFMAGSDNIDGTVQLLDEQQRPQADFDIKASYSLGGLGGGQSDARLGWLRDKFAQLTAQTILGHPQAAQAGGAASAPAGAAAQN